MFAERDHVHTLLYRHEWTARGAGQRRGARPSWRSTTRSGASPRRWSARLLESRATSLGDFVPRRFSPELELGFSPIPLPPDAPVAQQGQDRLDGCLLNLSFTTSAPDSWWGEQRAAADALRGDGIGEMLWTAPFIPTIPGTDAYTDQLW